MMARLGTPAGRRGAIVMMLTSMLPFLLLPMVGLAIDATVIHIVQAKLSAACDGAALGAGRLLGTNANITEIAGEFFKADFQTGVAGFWGATLPTESGGNPTITYTTGLTKTITVNAVANVPTLFMRIMGFSAATVSAAAQSTRRDSRIVFVIDRSGSMGSNYPGPDGNAPIADVIANATSFVERFTSGEDEMGLVVFDGSAVVGYPSSTTYSSAVTASGGPDTSFWDGHTAGGNSGDMVNQIGLVQANNGTGMAEALTLAYIELQKAHLRDIAGGATDDRLNSIILFTDGVPSAVSLYANESTNGGTWVRAKSQSNCSYVTDDGSHAQQYWIAAGSNNGNPPYSFLDTYYELANQNVASSNGNYSGTPIWWMSHPGGLYNPAAGDYYQPPNSSSSSPEYGCNQNTGRGISYAMNDMSYLTQIPNVDMWGNKLTSGDGNGYNDSYLIDDNGNNMANNSISGGNSYSQSDPTQAVQWGIAMWNAADDAAKSIRTDANYANRSGDTQQMQITIYCIGYAHDNFGVDAGLLKRIANDWSNTVSPNALPSSWYPPAQPQGIFVMATNLQELNNAFNIIASAILRLSR